VLSAQSNLPAQMFLFQDSALSQPAQGVPLRGEGSCTIFVCIQPNRKLELLKMYNQGISRQLIGGIRFKVSELVAPVRRKPPNRKKGRDPREAQDATPPQEETVELYEETIKFMAVLGKSVLKVSCNYIDLGSMSAMGKPVEGTYSYSLRHNCSSLNFNR